VLFGYVKIEPDTIVGRSGPGPGRSRPESIGTQTEVDTANQAVQAAPFTLNHRTQDYLQSQLLLWGRDPRQCRAD